MAAFDGRDAFAASHVSSAQGEITWDTYLADLNGIENGAGEDGNIISLKFALAQCGCR